MKFTALPRIEILACGSRLPAVTARIEADTSHPPNVIVKNLRGEEISGYVEGNTLKLLGSRLDYTTTPRYEEECWFLDGQEVSVEFNPEESNG